MHRLGKFKPYFTFTLRSKDGSSSRACLADGMGVHQWLQQGQLTHLERLHQCRKHLLSFNVFFFFNQAKLCIFQQDGGFTAESPETSGPSRLSKLLQITFSSLQTAPILFKLGHAEDKTELTRSANYSFGLCSCFYTTFRPSGAELVTLIDETLVDKIF